MLLEAKQVLCILHLFFEWLSNIFKLSKFVQQSSILKLLDICLMYFLISKKVVRIKKSKWGILVTEGPRASILGLTWTWMSWAQIQLKEKKNLCLYLNFYKKLLFQDLKYSNKYIAVYSCMFKKILRIN